MKSAVAYYLLLFYLAALCKPVLPVVSDFLAHTFIPEQHISTVHNETGSDHVTHEIADAAAHEEEDATGAKFSEPVSVHINAFYQFHFSFPLFQIKDFYNYQDNPLSTCLHVVIPPPKFFFAV